MRFISYITQILILTAIQVVFDFIGWFWVVPALGQTTVIVYIFRGLKFIFDFPLTIFVTLKYTRIQLSTLIVFYIFKMMHGCDSLYNVIQYAFGVPPAEYGDWRWWSFPFGWYETIKATIANGEFTKGIVSLRLATAESLIGLLIVIGYAYYKSRNV